MLLFITNTVQAKIELYLAYTYPVVNTKATSFPNDSFYIYQSKIPFISEPEIISLKPAYDAQLKMALIQIKLTKAAIQKFNKLARQNATHLDHRQFDKVVGLGVMVDHVTYQVIQGVHQPLPKNETTLFWTVSDMDISRDEANRISQKIINSFKK